MLNQKGLSLVEVLVSAFLVAMISLFAAQVIVDQKKAQRQLVYIDLKRELAEEIESDFAVYRRCTEMLKDSLSSQTILPAQFNQAVAAAAYDERFFHPLLKIEEVRLQYALAPANDNQQDGNLKTYKGTLNFKLSPRPDSLSDQMIQLKDIQVPITIMDKSGTGRWSEVVCSNSHTQTNSLISEACAYYGGTLIDGTHCDFGRFMRRHVDAGTSSVPIVNVNDTSMVDGKPRASRALLSDVMCYLDTLTTMVPDVQFTNREPALDRFEKDRNTLFCKRPGKVRQSPVVDMNAVFQTMSKDIRDRGYFSEVQNGF